LVDQATGRPLAEPDFALVPGPAAGEPTRRRLAFYMQSRADSAAPSPRRTARKARQKGSGAP
jgi:hypothetical protein